MVLSKSVLSGCTQICSSSTLLLQMPCAPNQSQSLKVTSFSTEHEFSLDVFSCLKIKKKNPTSNLVLCPDQPI